MKSGEFLRKRQEFIQKSLFQEAEKYCGKLKGEYGSIFREIEKETSVLFQKIQGENGRTNVLRAKSFLSKGEVKKFKSDVIESLKEREKISKSFEKKIQKTLKKQRISRLEAFKTMAEEKVERLYRQREMEIKSLIGEVYKKGRMKNLLNFSGQKSEGFVFSEIGEKMFEEILKKPWAKDGKNFFERIKKSKNELLKSIFDEVEKSVLTGKSFEETTRGIEKKINSDLARIQRLVLTESGFFALLAQQNVYKDFGVKEYSIVGVIDGKTCQKCKEMDRRVFKVSEMEAGINAPPFHPNCRCSTVFLEG